MDEIDWEQWVIYSNKDSWKSEQWTPVSVQILAANFAPAL